VYHLVQELAGIEMGLTVRLGQQALPPATAVARGDDYVPHRLWGDAGVLQYPVDRLQMAEVLVLLVRADAPFALDYRYAEPHMVQGEAVLQHLLQGVGERGVAQIMQQRRGQRQLTVLLLELQSLAHEVSHVIRAQGMLETSMVGAREDQVRQAQLLDPMQSLQLRTVQQFQENAVDLYAAVHTVVNYLLLWHGHVRDDMSSPADGEGLGTAYW
jgi:hypothetical protein